MTPPRPSPRGIGSLAMVTTLVLLTVAGCAKSIGAKPPDGLTEERRPTTTSEPVPTSTSDPAPGSEASSMPSTAPASTKPAPFNVYAATGAGMLRPDVVNDPAYVYVPSNDAGTVTVIDQATFKVVDTFIVGRLAQHVVPSHDMNVLYAAASGADRLVPIDPATGRPGKPIPISAPYNLYFTPDGTSAVVMAERLDRMDYYDPSTWALQQSVPVPCQGVNHADWSADERWFLVTCEFSGELLKVDSHSHAILDTVTLPAGSMPQDVRLTPDGTAFFVADMEHNGVWVVDAVSLSVVRLIPTGVGAHGLYPSRDGTRFYVSNRGRTMGDDKRRSRDGEGSVSVVDPATDTVTATWPVPGGGSPDMGGVSADGKVLWLSGRFDAEVYAFDTSSGALLARIPVPPGPHGLCVFPQPGRYSLGHTGNNR